MGSSPTLTQAAHPGHDPTVTDGEAAFGRLNPSLAFAHPNPYLPGAGPADPHARRELVRTFEEIDARGYRAWLEEANESPPTPPPLRQAVIRHRARRARLLAAERNMHARAHAERVFDRLNPEFGVPADTTDPRGRRALRDREAGLALGTRVAVAASRENDPTPVLRVAGQDYRTADAARAARQAAARQRHGPERAGPER